MKDFLYLLPHVTKKAFKDFWKEKNFPNLDKNCNSPGYDNIANFLLNKMTKEYKSSVNTLLFENIYNKVNRQFILPFNFLNNAPDFIDVNEDGTIKIPIQHPEIEAFIQEKETTCFFEESSSFLFVKFIKDDQGYLKNIILFKNMDIVETNESKKYFITVYNIDFNNKMLSIGYNENDFNKTQFKNNRFIDRSKTTVQEFLSFFKINLKNINPIFYKRLLFTLYERWNNEVEDILESKVPEGFNEIARDFLASIDVEERESYFKQIKSILFQEVARIDLETETKHIYPNGWVTRFLFKDEEFTRAYSRTDELEPVYTSPIYWGLKDIINEHKRLLELGLAINVSEVFKKGNPIIYIRLEIINDLLSLYLYKKGGINNDRIQKENLLRKRIRESAQALTPRGI